MHISLPTTSSAAAENDEIELMLAQTQREKRRLSGLLSNQHRKITPNSLS